MAKKYQFTRSIADSPSFRDVSVSMDNQGCAEFGKWRIHVSFLRWTGGRWMDVFHTEEFYSKQEAVEVARDHVQYLNH